MIEIFPVNIFLDDIRPLSAVNLPRHRFPGEWVVVRNYKSFCNKVNDIFQKTNGLPQFISFDHDLGEEHYSENMFDPILYNEMYKTFTEKTGLDCAKWLVEFCLDKNLKMCPFQVHSMNPVGKKNIIDLLDNFVKFQNDGNERK
jgi:hypothetical protein